MSAKTRTHRYSQVAILFLAAAIIAGISTSYISVPGYMDAEYYFMNGQTLASGRGFWEMILWNYLDDPQGLPHPSNSYWFPFPSMLAAVGMWLFQNLAFNYAQIPYIFFSACIPIISYGISFSLSGDEKKAFFAGLLALFPGFYLIYLTTTSTITPYLVFGGLVFWILILITRPETSQKKISIGLFSIGFLAGLMYLTRADGILWVAGMISIAFLHGLRLSQAHPDHRKGIFSLGKGVSSALYVFLGWIIVITPWIVRNFHDFGQFMPTGNLATLWLQDYNNTFIYPASDLNFSAWQQSGIKEILLIRWKSLLDNFSTTIIAEGEIILLPLFIMGVLQYRKLLVIKGFFLIWMMNFILMSLVFPFAGMRGGFFHSSAGFQTIIWAVVPLGFHQFIQWGSKIRKWDVLKSARVFQIFIVVILACLSVILFYTRVIGNNPESYIWLQSWHKYSNIEMEINNTFPGTNEIIIVNNPPGYYLASKGRPAIVLPDGDEQTLKTIANRYAAQIIAVDRNTVNKLMHLYSDPKSSDWLEYLYTVEDTRIYKVKQIYEIP